MFKKLRTKIVVAIMISIILILFGTLSIILATSYSQMNKDDQRMLQQYVNQYRLDEKEEIPLDKPKDFSEPDDRHKFDISTFYSVAYSNDGTFLKIDNGSKSMYSDDTLKSYAQQIINGSSKRGKYKKLTYLVEQKEGYVLVAFIDNAIMQTGMLTIFKNTLIFGGISVLVVFIVSIFLSKKIVAPLEENFQKQKQFISDAGHELKTPISVINANSELLSRQIGDNKWLSNIQYENEKMSTLVRQLLDLAKTESVKPQLERIDFSRLVSGELLPFESVAFEHHITLLSDIQEGINVDGDQNKLKQLVSILIENALSHSEENKEVNVILKTQRNMATLSVINEGKAIPVNQQERIFERFYRLDEARSDDGHFGLGLAIAKAIVESHNGKIHIECNDGKINFIVQLLKI